jgi:acyl-CoA thioester hydrolase
MSTSDDVTIETRDQVTEIRLRRRVQFYETDMAGVVHFSWYFRYMEEAEHELWRAAGLTVAPSDAHIAWPRVATSFEYKRPLRFEDEIEIRVRVASLTQKTIRFACTISRGEEDVATGSMTVACASHRPGEPMKGIAIPAEIAARLHVAADVE